MSASTQIRRNDASVSAMRENATCAPEMATNAAATPPAPLPKVRRASQATAGMVSVPRGDRNHDRREVADAKNKIG